MKDAPNREKKNKGQQADLSDSVLGLSDGSQALSARTLFSKGSPDNLSSTSSSDNRSVGNEPPKTTPHYHGHRERLRQRFQSDDGESFPDYELLELLLFYAIPRVDVKPLAKELIERFGSLGGVLNADPSRLGETAKIKKNTVVLIEKQAPTSSSIQSPPLV